MSEPKLISPLLDGFVMGDPISDRSGVRCCPALEKDTDGKFIVKIISNPASQSKLDALILSGAYPDVASATEYFKELSEGIIQELETLQELSKLEGFLPSEGWQLVPMDTAAGYDVYILSKYRKTLASHLKQNPITHLDAINLGLDLCASLAVCRRLGYLYVDLKPENIYLNKENAYRIGDIGFVKLSSLKYASLPDRYRSIYTAPEIADAFSSLNTTVDIYALGLILYQVFNAGQLPNMKDNGINAPFPAPDFADYEMAEIILKACDPDPMNRWQDPVEMGHALVNYMQRNGAHDTPIVPMAETASDDTSAEDSSLIDSADQAEDNSDTNDVTQMELETVDDDRADEATQESSDDSASNDIDSIIQESNSVEEDDETLPGNEAEDIDYNEVSEDVSDILNQADDLLAHPTPDPVVAPDPVEVTLPETAGEIVPDNVDTDSTSVDDEPEDKVDDPEAIVQESQEAGEASENDSPDASVSNDNDEETDEETDEDAEEIDEDITHNKKPFSWITAVILAVSAIMVGVLVYLFYTQFYLQTVTAFTLLDNANGNVTASITSEIDESKLYVICTDTYGNQQKQTVADGKVQFIGLKPDATYSLEIGINGFHKVTGENTLSFNTPTLTDIVQFLVVTGSEDGSAIVSFTVNGPDAEQWKLSYASAGEAEQTVTFSDHVFTVTGLTIGNEYTFTLTPESIQDFTGTNKVTHKASKVVKPNNLQVTGCRDNKLTVGWSAPEGVTVESWTVRCYNNAGFDMTQTVTDTSAEFDKIDPAVDYTIEVTASGMSVSERVDAPANSVTVFDIKIDETNPNKLSLTWNTAVAPQNGWLLQYTVDGSPIQKIDVSNGSSVTIPNRIPGAVYSITLQTGDGKAVFGGLIEHKTAEAGSFSGYGVTAKSMTFSMCNTPKSKNWDRFDLKTSDYTSTFKSGKKASFLVKMNHTYKVSSEKITTLYVIRDADGNVVSVASNTVSWKNMWYKNYCELNVPSIPETAGKYTISIYFNGLLAHQQSFTVTV